METFGSNTHQVFVKMLDGKHKVLNFNAPSIAISTLKHRIQTLTAIPSHLQLLLSNKSHVLNDQETLELDEYPENPQIFKTLDPNCDGELVQDRDFSQIRFAGLPENRAGYTGLGKFPVVVHLLLRLRGGKGGFGSLLRGAATKAGQKKTNNFDACRDMSGRRLRHVNAEKKLEEWRAEAGERKLEKMAEDFIKKKAKEVVKSGKGNGGDGTDKYVAKYREDSARCMEEVERSVRESIKGLASSKRKNGAEGSESASKRFKIWMGKRKLGDSDSEDTDKDDSEEEKEENEKSVVIDNGSHSDSSKEADASSGSVTGVDAESIDRGSFDSGSEEENPVVEESLNGNNPVLESLVENRDDKEADTEESLISQQPAADVKNSTTIEPVQEESVSVTVNVQDLEKPLNFDECHSAAELEVLGMERLKSELQARGLKCGGTLQERAARLFLLKTTPLEMLPKKLFAKK